MYVAGYPEESITFLLVGGGVFKFASVFGDAWLNVCVIDDVWPTSKVVLRKNICGQSRPYLASTNSYR